MIIGYARTSTTEQIAGLEAQLRELEAAQCQKIFQEQVSSVSVRAQLEAALEFTREGDVLVTTKLVMVNKNRTPSQAAFLKKFLSNSIGD